MCSDDCEYDLIKCGACGEWQNWKWCDTMGACPGNVFCLDCDEEIDSDGDVAPLCGECDSCESLIADGVFEKTQRHRLSFTGSR